MIPSIGYMPVNTVYTRIYIYISIEAHPAPDTRSTGLVIHEERIGSHTMVELVVYHVRDVEI